MSVLLLNKTTCKRSSAIGAAQTTWADIPGVILLALMIPA